jgi:UDP-2-acetamido-3-amino-2,3-dideoxy-glucuronate N-acetyltransferase
VPLRTERNYFAHESAIIDEPCQIGAGTKIWHFCHIMTGSRIGNDCSLGQNCFVASGVTIGRNVKIQNNVSVFEGVELEDNVFCGPSIVFTNISNPRSEIVRKGAYRRTVVRRGATIGANATVVCGHEIGEYAMIGAGAVVTSDVLPYALMLGVPARQCGWMSRCGHRLDFNLDNRAWCPESGEEYELVDGRVSPKDRESKAITPAGTAPRKEALQPLTASKRVVHSADVTVVRSQFTRRKKLSVVLLMASIAYYLLLGWLLLTPAPLDFLPDVCHRVLNKLNVEDHYHFFLFVPVGLLVAARWACVGGWTDIVTSIAFATGSEAGQFWIRSRQASLMDLGHNYAGLVVGVAIVGICLSFILVARSHGAFSARWPVDEASG